MYKDNDPSYKAIKSMMYEGDANCHDDNFNYKYSKALFNNNCSTITDVICDDEKYGEFSNLCILVSSFDDLYSKLSDENVFWTLFAPTDDAFTQLIDAKLDGYNLQMMDSNILNQLLRFHLVYGNEINREDLICSQPIITMFNGKDSRTQCVDGNIPYGQAGAANNRGTPRFTTKTNIKACNGAIHSIDQVLLDKEPNVTAWLKPTMQPSVSPSVSPSLSPSLPQSLPPSRSPFVLPSGLSSPNPTVSQKPSTSTIASNKPSDFFSLPQTELPVTSPTTSSFESQPNWFDEPNAR